MKVSASTAARSILASLIIAFVVFVLLLDYAPSGTFFGSDNYGWNGIQQASAQYSITPIGSLSGVSPNRSLILIFQPTVNFTTATADALEQFVAAGGTLLVADNSGDANSLLQAFGAGVQIESQYAIYDPTYNWGSEGLPTVLVLPSAVQQYGFLQGVQGIAMNAPSPLELENGSSAQVVAVSSPISLEVNRSVASSSVPVAPVTTGSFPVVAAMNIGNGTLVVVGDPLLFTNSVWALASNRVLAANLMANESVFLDTSQWQPDTGEGVRADIGLAYSSVSGVPLRYVATAAFVGLAVVAVPGLTRLRGREEQPRRTQQPRTFNKEVAERVKRDREKYGVQAE